MGNGNDDHDDDAYDYDKKSICLGIFRNYPDIVIGVDIAFHNVVWKEWELELLDQHLLWSYIYVYNHAGRIALTARQNENNIRRYGDISIVSNGTISIINLVHKNCNSQP